MPRHMHLRQDGPEALPIPSKQSKSLRLQFEHGLVYEETR